MSSSPSDLFAHGARIGRVLVFVLALNGSPSGIGAQEIGLLPVPEPSLETLDSLVQDQLIQEREAFERIRSSPGADADVLGAAYGRMGQLYMVYDVADAAEPCLVNASRLLPEDFRWHHYLGSLYVRVGDLEEARQEYEQAVEIGPRYVATKLRLGQVQLELGDLEAAELTFRVASALAPASAGAYQGLGKIAQERQQYDLAIRHFEKALELQPEAASIHHSLAMAYRQAGDAERAREHLSLYEDRPLVLIDPLMATVQEMVQGPEVHFNRGIEAQREGDTDTAIREFERTLELDPADEMAHYYLGLAWIRTWRNERQPEQLERGLEELRRALEIRPDYRDAHYVLGSMMGELGELDGALHHFAEAHRLDPDYLDAHLEWAVALGKTGETDRALSEMESVVTADPTFARAQLALATLLLEQSRFEEALVHYLSAVEYEDPLSRETVFAAATLAGRLGRFSEAEALFGRAIAVAPSSLQAHFGRTMALLLEGREAEAGQALEAGRRALPDNLMLANLQARFLATCADEQWRDPRRAVELARDIHQQAPSPEHAETLAMSLAAQGDFEEAVTWQRRAVEVWQSSGSEAALEAASARLESYESGRPADRPW